MVEKSEKQIILVVDDVLQNIDLLTATLKDKYKIRVATNGENAIKIAHKIPPPDLILLDVMMPGMNGFEVCRQLKNDINTQEIPIIFVTAKNEVADETEGFSLGAVDYISKPISPPIVQIRVSTQLELHHSRQILKEQNQKLIEMSKLKEDVEHITRHDLKSPINGIIGFTELLLHETGLAEEYKQSVRLMKELGYRTINMVNLSLGMVKMEQGSYSLNPEPMELIELFRGILSDIGGQIKFKRLDVKILLNNKTIEDNDCCFALGENLLCYSLFANLLKNAVEASSRKQAITIKFDNKANEVLVSIHNLGAVPEQIRNTFFDKYATAGKSTGTGLGTYSARLIAETQNGGISMNSSTEQGTTIIVNLPKSNNS